MARTNAVEGSTSSESIDSAHGLSNKTVDSLFERKLPSDREDDQPGTPHSYLSMPSCKQFPNARTTEPLHKVLEPVMVECLSRTSIYCMY